MNKHWDTNIKTIIELPISVNKPQQPRRRKQPKKKEQPKKKNNLRQNPLEVSGKSIGR